MNAFELLNSLEKGQTFNVNGPALSRELILSHGNYTGFGRVLHITGQPSLLAVITKLPDRAFMCGAGTIIELYRALSHLFFEIWKFDCLVVEQVQIKTSGAFTAVSPEGGKLETIFRVQDVGSGKFCGYTSTDVVLDCTIRNLGIGQPRIVYRGTMSFQFVDTPGHI